MSRVNVNWIGKKNVVALIAFVIFVIAGCSKKTDKIVEAETDMSSYDYQIYCTDVAGTELVTWGYDMAGHSSESDASITNDVVSKKVDAIMSALMSQPADNSMKSAVPQKLGDIIYSVESSVVNIRLDESYKSLYSLEQLFFKASLVLTLTQIEGIDYVYITVNGQPLTDANGVNIRYLTKNSFIMFDNTVAAVTSDFYTKLYYVNDAGNKLVAKDETFSYDRSMSPEMFVLELLRINGINYADINITMPEETVVNNAYTKNGICYVDFNQNINDKGFVGLKGDIMLYSVVNSLTELQNITGVKISIDGRDDVLFRGEIALDEIFYMNLDIIE